MNSITDKERLKTSIFNSSMQSNVARRPECFSERNTIVGSGFLASNSTKQNGFGGVLPRPSKVESLRLKEVNQLFKVPNFDNLPVKKASVKSVKSIISPRRRVQSGRVKNDLKASQQVKMSFLPPPSFINSRKSLHCSRSDRVNARKELIKKMVFLSECALKENREIKIKESTPVKVLAGLTPRKTPQSRSYFVLPELNKKVTKVEDLKNEIQDFVRKEFFGYSAKPVPLSDKKNEIALVKPSEDNPSFNSVLQVLKTDVNAPENSVRFSQMLCHCRTYNSEVNSLHEKLKSLDDCFESNLNSIPNYEVYKEFCGYQSRKEELYKELHCLEEELKNFIKTHTNIGNKIKGYIERKRELFEKQNKLHRDFEDVIRAALDKCKLEEVEVEEKPKEETPKVRRSLRLSKMAKKSKERTPMTRKLKKLDPKSKGIQRAHKVTSP